MRRPLRVVICGSRDWTDAATIRAWVGRLPPGSTVAHGDARGADKIGGVAAADWGFVVHTYPADWNAHGKSAGPIRNRAMLDDFKPDLVLAFTDTLVRARRLSGTGDCVAAANERGIRATVIPPGVLP